VVSTIEAARLYDKS